MFFSASEGRREKRFSGDKAFLHLDRGDLNYCHHLWVRLQSIILKYNRFEVRELLSFYYYDNESMSTVFYTKWMRTDQGLIRSLISITQLTVQDDD